MLPIITGGRAKGGTPKKEDPDLILTGKDIGHPRVQLRRQLTIQKAFTVLLASGNVDQSLNLGVQKIRKLWQPWPIAYF